MTHTIPRRQLIALTVGAVVPASLGQDDDAASIRDVVVRLRRLYETLDIGALPTVVAPTIAFADPTFHYEAAGLEALQALFSGHVANILAMRVTVERELILPPWAIVQQTQTATMKTPAGPRTAAARGVSLYRVERGRVVEWWDYYDAAGFHKQLAAPGDRR
jgi:hypothetical protein